MKSPREKYDPPLPMVAARQGATTTGSGQRRKAVTSFLLFAALGIAQDQTGSVSGVVLDAVSHQPVRKATVSLLLRGGMGARTQNVGPQSTITDITGAFSMNNLVPAQYMLTVQHQNYPQAQNGPARKSIEIKAGEKAGPVNLELIPGAAVAGHVVDEDGDPLSGCVAEARSFSNPNQGYSVRVGPASVEDGSFRIFEIPPGKYVLAARCQQPAFVARPFSAGPDTPPSAAYPVQFYPATSDPKSAEVVDLAPGSEKAGIEFRMRPAAVTQIHGTLAAGADGRDRSNLMVQMVSIDDKMPRGPNPNSVIDREKGTFEFRQVFPGSYMLIAFNNGSPEARIGAMQRIDVKDQPVEAVVNLRPGMDIEGTVQTEGNPNNNTAATNPNAQASTRPTMVQLTPEYQMGISPSNAQVKDDGTFVLGSVLPALWRLRVQSPSGFLKSAWMGTTEVTNGLLDLTSGAAGALKLVVSTNTAAIHGTGPAGQIVLIQETGDTGFMFGTRGTQVDQSGQFKLDGLPPGKYRISASEMGGPPPDEGGQEITLHEGETLMVDVKARSN